MTPDKTPTDAELEALARKHGATSYRNRADTQHPAYGFTEDGLRNLLADALAKWGSPVVAVEPHDPGPWQVDHWKAHDEIVLQSHHFEHDVALVVNGDFANLDQKKAYAARLCAWMNAATPQPTRAQAGAVAVVPLDVARYAVDHVALHNSSTREREAIAMLRGAVVITPPAGGALQEGVQANPDPVRQEFDTGDADLDALLRETAGLSQGINMDEALLWAECLDVVRKRLAKKT